MMSRGRLEYTGFHKPVSWSAPSLAALPVTHELLVVPDLQKDHRHAPAPPFHIYNFPLLHCAPRECVRCSDKHSWLILPHSNCQDVVNSCSCEKLHPKA